MLNKIKALNEIAEQRGQSLAQMALAWVYRNEAVTSVLIGASKPEQIIDNVNMLKNTEFTEEELKKIDEIALR
jgi:L-glyceraldehyde 3-phosphate reductase